MQPPFSAPTLPQDPDQTADLETLIADVIPDHETWMRTPNPVLGGKRPMDLLGSPHEKILRDMVRAVKHGMFS